MEDKIMMSAVLGNIKGMCDLMMHGTIESATQNVHTTFKCALNDMLTLQNQMYNKMAEKGWYPSEQAETQKIEAAKQQFINAG